jgi:hypothetical protein
VPLLFSLKGQPGSAPNGDTLLPEWTTLQRTFLNVSSSTAASTVMFAPVSCGSTATCIRPAAPPSYAPLQTLSYDPSALLPGGIGGLLSDSLSNSFAGSPVYTPAYLGTTNFSLQLSDTCVIGTAYTTATAVCNAPVLLNITTTAPAVASSVPGAPAAIYVPFGTSSFPVARLIAQVWKLAVSLFQTPMRRVVFYTTSPFVNAFVCSLIVGSGSRRRPSNLFLASRQSSKFNCGCNHCCCRSGRSHSRRLWPVCALQSSSVRFGSADDNFDF